MKRAVYADYLQLEKILGAQKPLSGEKGDPIHEELFFIIVHQVYELWFKQIIADLDSIFEIFLSSSPQKDMELIIIRLQRVNKILHLLIQQFEVLETMSPLEFLNFRSHLNCMSGFQSAQFRLFEAKFGLKKDDRMTYQHCPYNADLNADQQKLLDRAEGQSTLFDHISQWLDNFPYLKTKTFDFIKSYHSSFNTMVEEEKTRISQLPNLTDADRSALTKRIEEQFQYFHPLFDEKLYQEQVKSHQKHLPYKAFAAALFIRLYRHHPYLHIPDVLLTEVFEVNALFTLWRFRHSMMVKKMIGEKTGTGGSSGVQYLQETVGKYNIFSDLDIIPMVLLPKNYAPILPEGLLPTINYFFHNP